MEQYRKLVIQALNIITRLYENDPLPERAKEWVDDAKDALRDDPNHLQPEDYQRRALPRLEAIERLAKRIDFTSLTWIHTQDGERYSALMNEQAQDEHRAGL